MVKKASTGKNKFPVIPVIIAIIGCCGTVGAALVTGYFGYLTTRTQIDRPVLFTQTAESKPTTLPTNTNVPTPTESTIDWGKIMDVYHDHQPCYPMVIPEFMFSGSDPLKWIEENSEKYALDNSTEFMYSPDFDLDQSVIVNLTLRNISEENNDWARLEKEVIISVNYIGDVPETSHVVDVFCGGGGGFERLFSETPLINDFNKYDSRARSTDDVDFYTLEPGEFEAFQMTFICEYPGIYSVQFNIPVTYQGQEGIFIYDGIKGIVCPDKVNYYIISGGGSISDVRKYNWSDSGYIEISP